MNPRLIDLRSDTATRPTLEMREVMSRAEVGDDSSGEDPTVNRLLEKSAKIFGKEAAIFVPSGTQANQITINVYTQPGEEVIADSGCHPYRSELGAAALISSIQFSFVSADRGVYDRKEAESVIRPLSERSPRSAIIWVENTHNAGGGQVFPLDKLEELRALSNEQNIPLHIDGARIFNAIVASGIQPEVWGQHCDSLSFCLSKGLGCPVGSILMGTREFINQARKRRKILGGSWRQAGILAAAGLHALEHHVERLEEDHQNAQLFAEKTSGIPGIRHLYETTPTNIVYMDTTESGKTAQEISEMTKKKGVALSVLGKMTLRAVTHIDINREDIDRGAKALAEAVA
ncbi:MAG: aminotransferase class I/II-fold pyridoxal phosphate-dependent enzyme [Nitrospinaceae bacterium]|nr:aminotransferase class I/II-fold pyridoxal phosphate-dependent enzyme [Nitrospinaceae bacterium]MBT3435327.1 aminotransferase class I/II-fold pyridoxal phosphate-dependent enzyme [Nitrospinaceae bacterium]MBT3820614.1 aminotransferase class I/II-fold pyridoxal phosphate-dependent enzyme [Nitrospinaceae bacterium]MBT4094778.1 aminotransferase class I/II-fold pyridoxal phosphate-dependent enzyme [Nitrospinaceae bacterium]MBT5366512.1 aminotransferase class I/II-fold pyridoxal phosphate-depende